MRSNEGSLLALGAIALFVIIVLLIGSVFLCAAITHIPKIGNYVDSHPAYYEMDNSGLIQRDYYYNGSLAGFDTIELDVHNMNGNVIVKEGDADEYEIEVHAKGTEKDFANKYVEFVESGAAGTKTLKVAVKDHRWDDGRNFDRFYSDIIITLPKNKHYGDMQLNTVNGNVDVCDLSGDHLLMTAVNGKLTSSFNADNSELVNVNGNIYVTTSKTTGKITATTVNGNINMNVPENSEFKIEAHSASPVDKISVSVPVKTSKNNGFTFIGETENYNGNGIVMNFNLVNGNIEIDSI
ncbi:hypothetical protein CUJ83_00915 [Methanocella sp. CWC-04]|uniref:DUF4097 domain-containing protein n=1 Tax=Methanooceanicella nereidis TaxID=2052831 RepID=A0AAP2RAP8_9EURY|nr:DUF4097 family beta strand repeat-containing protein [Methanocella sp. CWC-04]MCD1293557.1 hypothetical protein [Methanocella sp. CWC-04]